MQFLDFLRVAERRRRPVVFRRMAYKIELISVKRDSRKQGGFADPENETNGQATVILKD
jgi:hypothetical protein